MRERGHPDALLSAFLDDELDEDAALRVTRHVADCEVCEAELQELRAARTALRGLPRIHTPPALLADVPAAARRADAGARTRLVAVGALVGMAGLLGAAFVLGGGEPGDVVPPVDVVVVDHVVRTGAGPVIQPVDLDR